MNSSSQARLDSVSRNGLRKLHRGVLSDSVAIISLLEQACAERVEFRNGVDRKSEPRTAIPIKVTKDELFLEAPNLRASGQPQLYLHFELKSTRYFFASPPLSGGGEDILVVALPSAIYEAERRDLLRIEVPFGVGAPPVRLFTDDGRDVEGQLRDWSYQGMGVAVADELAVGIGKRCRVEAVGAGSDGEHLFGMVRRRVKASPDKGWTTLGLEVSRVDYAEPLPVERRERVLGGSPVRQAWRKVALAGAMAKRLRGVGRIPRLADDQIQTATYPNSRGQEIHGLVDTALGGEAGVAVVIPPAWGRTKETFLALARSICSTLEKTGTPAVVLRFDGTNRRGESYVDPDCRAEGDEYLRFRFSQAVDDIRSSLRFVKKTYRPEKVVLVSFSLGAIEARRAAAAGAPGELDGWISVVGMVDLQSGLRTVSGGLDFAYGQSIGVKFGRHELVGVVADMDFTGGDAFEHQLVFLEDAKRDVDAISIPITWIHGKYDAWMELDRVRSLLSAGNSTNRRLIEIPSGHQMRSSTEALETFQLVSSEVFRLCFGREVEPALPDLADLERRSNAERARRPSPGLNRVSFWSDYLLGRDRRFGFELMSATSPYRGLMNLQIERLEICGGSRVLDLGGGAGDFEVNLAESSVPAGVSVTQLDLVPDALRRSRDRIAEISETSFRVTRLAADLEISEKQAVPLRDQSFDRIIASLVLSYVANPELLIVEILRLLKPGGKLVISSMRKDADISRIYVNSLAELPPDRRSRLFGDGATEDFEELQRVFLNDAAKLIQLEEDGRFRFFSDVELSEMLEACGLVVDRIDYSFGEPSQAVVVTASRRE